MERALKKAILHRKNSLFYKTRKGARLKRAEVELARCIQGIPFRMNMWKKLSKEIERAVEESIHLDRDTPNTEINASHTRKLLTIIRNSEAQAEHAKQDLVEANLRAISPATAPSGRFVMLQNPPSVTSPGFGYAQPVIPRQIR